MVQRNILNMTAKERSSYVWLSTDEVLEKLSMGRSTLWKKVKKGSFPEPYRWKEKALWTTGDIDTFIEGCINNTIKPKYDYVPITWDAIINIMKHEKKALTNSKIAELLDADYYDVTVLTRLMAKCGVLTLFKPVSHGRGSTNLYTYNS